MSREFIEEDFFPLNIYDEIVQQLMTVEYGVPNKYNTKIHEGCYWHEHILKNNCDVQNEIKKLVDKKFNFNINNFIQSIYTMVGANDMPRPHQDMNTGATHQCLIYMYGEESANNGTGFYHETGTTDEKEYELSIHTGFKKNRAVFFSSDIIHSPLQWAGNGSFRYSICNFFN